MLWWLRCLETGHAEVKGLLPGESIGDMSFSKQTLIYPGLAGRRQNAPDANASDIALSSPKRTSVDDELQW